MASIRTTARALPTLFRIGFAEAVAYRAEFFVWILSTTMPLIMLAIMPLFLFGGRNLVMADQVHPTALGQIAIAERALARLESDGLPARVAPASLIRYEITRGRRLRADWTYLYRTGKIRLRAAAVTALLRLGSR